MKLARLFLDGPIGLNAGSAGFNVAPVKQGSPGSSAILFEWPVACGEVPFVTQSILPGGRLYLNMGIWILNAESMAAIDGGPFLHVYEKPTLALQKLVSFAQTVHAPFVRAFDGANVPFERMLGVWLNYPDVFYACIARHKPPSLLTRQNFYMVLRWSAWNHRRRTMQERVDEMEIAGHGGGKLNAANLSKRARDLGLS